MTLSLFIYFLAGLALAWPIWKLIRMFVVRNGLIKSRGRCFVPYVAIQPQQLSAKSERQSG